MKKLNLQEAPKTVAFAFGRFNPPTIGHEKLLDKVASMRADEYLIYVSHTRNPKTDPLEYSLKIAYMQRSFPKHKRNIIVSKARTIFEILVELQKQYNPNGAPLKSLIMVVGSDRVKEFEGLINKYNGVKATHGYYNFQNIQVKSAGERDPDAEGVEGMSASKMRVAAADSDFDSFKQGTPLNDVNAKKLYFSVRSAMGIREELDLTNYEVLRDLYLSEQIWNVGELIRVRGSKDSTFPTWEIIRRGTNYVTVIDESYNTRKIWLHDIEIDDVASRLDKSRIYPRVDESWFDDLVSKIKSKTIRKSAYQYAKDLLQSVIDRKKRDKTLKHDKLYYAQRIGDQIPGVDYKMLAKMVKEEVEVSEETELDLNTRDTIIEASVKYGVPYDILKKIYHNEELSESEIKIAREEIKEYWLIGTEEYDEYLKNLTPGENDESEDRLNNKTKKLRLKDES